MPADDATGTRPAAERSTADREEVAETTLRVAVPGGELTLDAARIDAPSGAVRRQVREYARGERRAFDLPVSVPDSFTGRVMRRMLAIPHGETRTYGDLAGDLDTAAVAVGQACGRNPVPLVVPCHRVVGRDSLGGYSADGGVALKRALLAHEGARVPGVGAPAGDGVQTRLPVGGDDGRR